MDEREITLATDSVDEFREEKLPLYTAIKREGKIIWGDADLSVYPDPPVENSPQNLSSSLYHSNLCWKSHGPADTRPKLRLRGLKFPVDF